MNTSDRINNSEETWAFLKKFSLGQTPVNPQQTYSVTHDKISASYSSGTVRLQGVRENCRVKVIDTRGRLVAAAEAASRQFEFKNRPAGVYMLLLDENGKRFTTLRLLIP